MKNKTEEVIPEIIKRLSRGEALSTDDIVQQYGVTASSFKERFKDVRDMFYSRFIKSDKSTGKWIGKQQFLEKILLTPEETVILTGLLRKKNEFGHRLVSEVDKLVDKYIKRTKTSVYRQDSLERINASMEKKFAQIKYAIDNSKQISLKIYGYKATVYPYKIVNLEYYWYLLGYEAETEGSTISKKVKTYTIAKIEEIIVLEESFIYNFSSVDQKLKHAMNAFFDVDRVAKTIEVLVIHWYVQYIKRAEYFSGWHPTGEIVKIENVDYFVYEIKSTDEKYRDVIPTIFTHIPKIRLRNDESVSEAMFTQLEIFANAHNKTIKNLNS